MTKKYRKLSILFGSLSAICLILPIAIYFIRAFAFGDATQKLTLGLVFTISAVLFVINLIMKSHSRSIFWVLLIGIISVCHNYLSMIIVFAITTFLEELIFSPLHRFYKSKARINKEIDRRIGTE